MTTSVAEAREVRRAAEAVALLKTDQKNALLRDLAARLRDGRETILGANARDLEAAREAGLPQAKLRRLELNDAGIEQMAEGVEQVADLPDPVGEVVERRVVPSGLAVERRRTPLGVILMIYEARPNVTIDAFALCFKAGNACILKGGKEARHSNVALARIVGSALRAADIPAEAIVAVVSSDRDELKHWLQQDEWIDLVIPRGGAELIRFVHETSSIPTVQHFHGVCHVYVDAEADRDKAREIAVTGKISAPATCNATEAVLVDRSIAEAFVPGLVESFAAEGVEVRADEAVCKLAAGAVAASDDDWGCEFLDKIVAVRLVDGIDDAIAHIRKYGSNHTEAIVTEDVAAADRFTREVAASCVLVNASTRFNDGFQLGLGAEIGISTCKVHAYGPMGLESLTIPRWVVHGTGQTR